MSVAVDVSVEYGHMYGDQVIGESQRKARAIIVGSRFAMHAQRIGHVFY